MTNRHLRDALGDMENSFFRYKFKTYPEFEEMESHLLYFDSIVFFLVDTIHDRHNAN